MNQKNPGHSRDFFCSSHGLDPPAGTMDNSAAARLVSVQTWRKSTQAAFLAQRRWRGLYRQIRHTHPAQAVFQVDRHLAARRHTRRQRVQHQVQSAWRQHDMLVGCQLQCADLAHLADSINHLGAVQGHAASLQAGQPVQTHLHRLPAGVVQLAIGGGHIATGHRRAYPALFEHQARRGQTLGPGRATHQQQGGRNQQHFDYHRPDPLE